MHEKSWCRHMPAPHDVHVLLSFSCSCAWLSQINAIWPGLFWIVPVCYGQGMRGSSLHSMPCIYGPATGAAWIASSAAACMPSGHLLCTSVNIWCMQCLLLGRSGARAGHMRIWHTRSNLPGSSKLATHYSHTHEHGSCASACVWA